MDQEFTISIQVDSANPETKQTILDCFSPLHIYSGHAKKYVVHGIPIASVAPVEYGKPNWSPLIEEAKYQNIAITKCKWLVPQDKLKDDQKHASVILTVRSSDFQSDKLKQLCAFNLRREVFEYNTQQTKKKSPTMAWRRKESQEASKIRK